MVSLWLLNTSVVNMPEHLVSVLEQGKKKKSFGIITLPYICRNFGSVNLKGN